MRTPNNPNSLWGTYFPDEQGRFFNRATQGQYPPGSIFKVITLSAGAGDGEVECHMIRWNAAMNGKALVDVCSDRLDIGKRSVRPAAT